MKVHNHKFVEYSVLLLGVVAFVLLFWYFRTDSNMKIIITGVSAIFYSLWGILHHSLEGRISMEIVLEYVLIGFFVFLLVLTALSV